MRPYCVIKPFDIGLQPSGTVPVTLIFCILKTYVKFVMGIIELIGIVELIGITELNCKTELNCIIELNL